MDCPDAFLIFRLFSGVVGLTWALGWAFAVMARWLRGA